MPRDIFSDNEPSDEEIMEDVSDQTLRHMHLGENINYLSNKLFDHTGTLVDGTTKDDVARMTTYAKIGLLERMYNHTQMQGTGLCWEIGAFLEDISEDEKRGFKTTDDYN